MLLLMSALAQILSSYRRNLDIVKRELEGVTEEQSHQVIGQSSSLNWIVGHQLSARTRCLEMLELKIIDIDAVAIQARYGNGTKPGSEGAMSLQDLYQQLEKIQSQMEEGLPQIELSKEVDSPFGVKSKAELLDFFAWHEGYHVGQVVLLKRALQA